MEMMKEPKKRSFFNQVWHDIKAFVGGGREDAEKGYFHGINRRKNRVLEDADAEVEGRKEYLDPDDYPKDNKPDEETRESESSMDPTYGGRSTPTYKRKKRTDSTR